MESAKLTKLFILVPLTLLMLSSCGSDGSDGKDAPQEEQACLTTNQEQDIRTFMNRLSGIAVISGVMTASRRNTDGTTTTIRLGAAWDFIPRDDNGWTTLIVLCDQFGNCDSTEILSEFRSGCFFVSNDQAQIISSSPSSLRMVTVDSDGSKYDDHLSISSSDDFKYREEVSRNGQFSELYIFE